VAPGDKTSRRLQSTLAEAFKPLETFDCPGTVSLIGFNLKSFTQIAKHCIFFNQTNKLEMLSLLVVSCFIFPSPTDHLGPHNDAKFFFVDLHWSVMVSCFYIPTSEDVNDH